MKEKFKKFIEENKSRLMAGVLAATFGLSSLFGFVWGKDVGNKEYEDAHAHLKDKNAQVETLEEENQELVEKYQEALQVIEDMKTSNEQTEAEISEMVQVLADCIHNDKYGQGERLAFYKTVKVIEEYVNNQESLSAEDRQAIMTVVDNLEHNFISDNILNAGGNTFANDAIKIVSENVYIDNGKTDSHEKITMFMDRDYEVGIYHENVSDFSNVYITDNGGDYTRCDVGISESGKLINPIEYKEGKMYDKASKDSFCTQTIAPLLYMVKELGGEWSYDVKEDCYTVKFADAEGQYTIQADLNGNNLERMSSSGKGVNSDLTKSEVTFEGITKEEYQAQYDMVAKLIEEAKALKNEQENGGPSL